MSGTVINESDILERVLNGSNSALTVETATSLLGLHFPEKDTNRIRSLLKKNNDGTISDAELLVLEKYLRVGQFLDLLHARARAVLARGTRGQ